MLPLIIYYEEMLSYLGYAQKCVRGCLKKIDKLYHRHSKEKHITLEVQNLLVMMFTVGDIHS
jgi:hypothetical protein